MSPEKFPTPAIEGEGNLEKGLAAADAVEKRLVELGWSAEQLGEFKKAIRGLVMVMARADKGGPEQKVSVDFRMVKDKTGEEVAEVTVTSEGKGFGPEQIAELEPGEVPVEIFTDADDLEIAEEGNKVILWRKKNRTPETDSIG
jgi:hypothetical protein